ncbi:hypothetical protein EV383_4088 [Pseudonocardia sediminis]|uniref:Uncharacterized protein n=2 Tax=Pseudonocardia sediminis TaxID=1397368 RepID=A0A4Q7V177_PSEST|nr:hypothetical protein EV383_4088 [Pseudonocardia sediminis]
MRWYPRSWRDRLVDYRSVLDQLPSQVCRSDAAEWAVGIDNAHRAGEAFVAAMVWGYGPVGYGPYRTARILEENEQATERLLKIAEPAVEGDRMRAFRQAANSPLKHLGVAFGTKFLYFCSLASGDDRAIAPVLDSVVADWLSQHTPFSPKIDSWRPKDYERYVDLLQCWADQLDERIDTVEQLIFDSEWAVPAGTRTPTADIASTLAQLRRLVNDLDPAVTDRCEPHLTELRALTSC